MRDQSLRNTQDLYEELTDISKPDNLPPHYPSWDSEELDLSARYKKVENYISGQAMGQPQKKSDYYKPHYE